MIMPVAVKPRMSVPVCIVGALTAAGTVIATSVQDVS